MARCQLCVEFERGEGDNFFGTPNIGIHKNVLGRDERNEVIPSIEIARNIADILDVSLDYLVGKVDVEMDKTIRNRIFEVSKFDEADQHHIFSFIDTFVAKRKIQSIL